jgi:urease accessory protein
MTVWDKSLAPSLTLDGEDGVWLEDFRSRIRTGDAKGHFGVSWGLICRLAKLDLDDVCYVFIFNQARAILSAAVRLGLIGPYQSQGILAMASTQAMIQLALVEGRKRSPEEAGQTVATLDIYQGRHELLYSRVFNS